jgi:hypothetical protein
MSRSRGGAAAHLLTRDEAWRIAVNIAKLQMNCGKHATLAIFLWILIGARGERWQRDSVCD